MTQSRPNWMIWLLAILGLAAMVSNGCSAGVAEESAQQNDRRDVDFVAELPPAPGAEPPVDSVEPAPDAPPTAAAEAPPTPEARTVAEAPPPVVEAPAVDEERLAQRERELAALEAELAAREREIAEREAAARRAQLAAREREIAAREEALARRRAEEEERARLAEASRVDPVPAEEPRPVVGEPVLEEPAAEAGRTAEVPRELPEPTSEEPTEAELRPAPVLYEEPAPTHRSLPVTLPAGTEFEVEILDDLSSRGNREGDPFRARIVHDVRVGGEVAVPAGIEVEGVVLEAKAAKRIGRRALLAIKFERLRLPDGETVAIAASLAERGRDKRRRDAAAVGGGALGGAILGRVIDDDRKGRGSVIGAIVGAAVGAAVASRKPGKEIEIEAGTVVPLRLDEWARIPAR